MLNNDVTQFIKQDKLLQNRVIGVSAIFFIIYCSYYISGYSSQYHNYIITVFFVCWNICALMEDYYSYSKAFMCKSMFFLVLFLLYYFLMSLFNGTIVYTLKYLVIFTTLYGLVFQCRYYLIRNREREIKFILVLTTVVFWIFSINAIAFYFVNPSAARVLAADYYAFDAIAVGGGYSIAFGAALLSVYVFELLIRKKVKRKGYVLLFVVGILILEVLIFMTESTITLIANLVGLIVAFLRMMYYGKDNNAKVLFSTRKLLTIFIVLVIFIAFILNIQTIGRFIIDATSGHLEKIFFRRINRIGEKLLYTGTGVNYVNYIDERFNTIKISWHTFLENPVLGVGYKCGNNFSELKSLGVGTHSALFDLLAQHGIVGTALWLTFFISALKNQRINSSCKGYFITLIIMMILNPFTSFHGYFVLFMLIPMLEHSIIKNE